ncbi:hypothetical protein AX768_24960 [Burkholderia sp. PAMC 28687]|uniref:hypothetical protein n=1 Tax=Burkholderia sp. PAMC 28687 TaxID=1795874 RepID=UPI0007832D8C|nr:hypothetical protein [Burkholderia sp. PAMC 28687]AMM17460.1 hypothetical protein AX768_24960 [Burkholderia sp. PAMC 28687]
MARRAASGNGLFAVAEATLISLYDGGVLSPAVLERVIAGFANSAIDWHSAPGSKSVDGRSLHEVVAITMMPGRAIRNPSKEFFAVVEHVGGRSIAARDAKEEPEESPETEPEDEPDDELMSQLAGAGRKGSAGAKKAGKTARKSAPSPGFNPLFHATPPGRARKS